MSFAAASPSSRRAWIEMCLLQQEHRAHWSPSSRRAWIEISKLLVNILPLYVALLAEGVDRNAVVFGFAVLGCSVALLAEGVDRN